MGADFLYATLPQFDVTDERIAELESIVATLDESTFENFMEETIDDCRTKAVDYVHDLRRLPNSRETGTIQLDNTNHWITGGMSWGDDPTEAYATMSIIYDLDPVYEKITEYSQTDTKSVTPV